MMSDELRVPSEAGKPKLLDEARRLLRAKKSAAASDPIPRPPSQDGVRERTFWGNSVARMTERTSNDPLPGRSTTLALTAQEQY
jgi:hypothetical protein